MLLCAFCCVIKFEIKIISRCCLTTVFNGLMLMFIGSLIFGLGIACLVVNLFHCIEEEKFCLSATYFMRTIHGHLDK